MRVFRRVLAVLLVLVVVAAVAGYFYARPLLRTGTGYAAHNACAVELLAGRENPENDLPDNPVVPFITGYVNEAGRSATSQILFSLSTQKAWYTRGFENGSHLRTDVNRAQSLNALRDTIRTFFGV